MFQLARWVQQISAENTSGKIHARFTYAEFKKEVEKVIVGQDEMIETIIIALFSDGRVLDLAGLACCALGYSGRSPVHTSVV